MYVELMHKFHVYCEYVYNMCTKYMYTNNLKVFEKALEQKLNAR
jgi:hypothetical protein